MPQHDYHAVNYIEFRVPMSSSSVDFQCWVEFRVVILVWVLISEVEGRFSKFGFEFQSWVWFVGFGVRLVFAVQMLGLVSKVWFCVLNAGFGDQRLVFGVSHIGLCFEFGFCKSKLGLDFRVGFELWVSSLGFEFGFWFSSQG